MNRFLRSGIDVMFALGGCAFSFLGSLALAFAILGSPASIEGEENYALVRLLAGGLALTVFFGIAIAFVISSVVLLGKGVAGAKNFVRYFTDVAFGTWIAGWLLIGLGASQWGPRMPILGLDSGTLHAAHQVFYGVAAMLLGVYVIHIFPTRFRVRKKN